MKIQHKSEFLIVFESALYRTTTTLVRLKEGLLLVDPNWLPDEISFVKHYITEHFPNQSLHILFTHSDYDHIIGYGAFPEAKTYGSKAFSQSDHKEAVVQEIMNFYNTYYIVNEHSVEYPCLDTVVAKNGQIVNLGGMPVHFFLSPGHTDDGLFAIIPDLGIWIAGDYLSNIEIPMVDGRFSDYFETLQKMMDIYSCFQTINILISGHGDIALSRTDIFRRIRNDTLYLSHFEKNLTSFDRIDGEHISDFITRYSSNPQLMKIHRDNVEKWLKAE
jgi:hydroxyacylglutathione hydrolase